MCVVGRGSAPAPQSDCFARCSRRANNSLLAVRTNYYRTRKINKSKRFASAASNAMILISLKLNFSPKILGCYGITTYNSRLGVGWINIGQVEYLASILVFSLPFGVGQLL